MIIFFILGLPLLAAFVSVLPFGRRLAPAVTLITCVIVLVLTIEAALRVTANGNVTAIRNWIAIDGLSALVLLLIATVGSTAALFSWGYLADEKSARHLRRYYANYNLFIFAMLTVPALSEPNLVWTGVELTTILSVYLVAFENTGEALEAAWKYSILTIMGGAIALLGFLAMYAGAVSPGSEQPYTWNTLVAAAPNMSPGVLETAFALILVGFGAKSGLVPLHTWLPDAHSQAPSPICALLSGIKTTVIIYVILRLIGVLGKSGKIAVGDWAMTAGLISVGVAALLIIQVTDYKRLFAFSTVEHMGIILTAAGIGGAAGHYGAVYQILNHTLTKSFCFFAAGTTLLAVKTRRIADVRGLIHTSPAAGAALLFGGLAIAGAPPLAVFLSEFSILRSGVAERHYITVALLASFVGLAFFGILYHLNGMVFGLPEPGSREPGPIKLPATSILTLLIAAAPIVILGVYIPKPLAKLLQLAALNLTR